MNLWDILAEIKEECRFVDLSYEVSPETPHWSGFPDMRNDVFFSYENDGFYANEYHMVSQYGTHVDAPCHFIAGGRSVDMIQPEELLAPLCVIDVSEKAADNVDYAASVQDIKDWEAENGAIPHGAFVALRTDWSKRADLDNYDSEGNKHYPAWGLEAVRFLVDERDIAAIGHETSDTDPPALSATRGYAAEQFIFEKGRYQIELLRNLDLVPSVGAIIACGFPAVKDGAGFTARCIAICRKDKASE